MITFNQFIKKYKLKDRATSNIKNSKRPDIYWYRQC